MKHGLDAAIDDTLTDRARDLPPLDGTGRLADDADTVVQVLTPDGGLRAHSARAGTTPLITPAQLAAVRTRPTQTERDQVAGLPGRARLLATPGPDGTVVVVAASLAGRDNAVADLQTELWTAFPIVLLIAAAGLPAGHRGAAPGRGDARPSRRDHRRHPRAAPTRPTRHR